MNFDVIKGNWNQMRGEVQSEWGKLTDDEVAETEGDARQLLGLIQERYGLAKDEAERQMNDFIARQKAS
ncbi:CsbD family protein [Roseobacter sp.]|uniref:CsbD family protein n=1 Tax=Roseobacter sp. TaxID=1907202 RepID=UPI0025D3879D|nr:CsbD family protein [Roseobacter sp.]